MKTGIIGGTFDPIHLGHLAMAESVREIFELNEVLFIPSARPPHKTEKRVSQEAHRLMMTYLAIKSNPYFQLSAVEIMREGPSYTLDTVNELNKKFGKGMELFFMIGTDQLAELPTWYKSKELVSKVHFIAVTRPGASFDMAAIEEFFGESIMTHIHQITTPGLEISSTDIRERVKLGRSIKYLVPEVVEEYIKKERLYRDD